jgi:hypothetical protein
MREPPLSEPWRSFLDGVDRELDGPVELHCFGGFVLAEHYKLTRPTADVDVIAAHGSTDLRALQEIAGRGSALATRHRVYLDIVTIATVPDDYEARLLDMCPGQFDHLRLKAFERHDLALAKLARNADHDREDVKRLAAGRGLDVDILRSRYQKELRFQFGNAAAADLTLELWIEMIIEIQTR